MSSHTTVPDSSRAVKLFAAVVLDSRSIRHGFGTSDTMYCCSMIALIQDNNFSDQTSVYYVFFFSTLHTYIPPGNTLAPLPGALLPLHLPLLFKDYPSFYTSTKPVVLYNFWRLLHFKTRSFKHLEHI